VGRSNAETVEEARNLRRVGGLARDLPGSRFGETLWSRCEDVPYALGRSSRGEVRGSTDYGRESRDPGEVKTQEGIGLPAA